MVATSCCGGLNLSARTGKPVGADGKTVGAKYRTMLIEKTLDAVSPGQLKLNTQKQKSKVSEAVVFFTLLKAVVQQ